MKFTYGTGGIVIQSKSYHFCIFPANVRFAKSKQVVIVFGIGFSYSKNS